VQVQIFTKKFSKIISSEASSIQRLAKCEISIVGSTKELEKKNSVTAISKDIEICIPLEGLIDLDKEREKLEKEQKQLEGFLKGVMAKLNNKKFVDNAPAEVLEKEKAKKETAEGKLKKISERLSAMA